MILNWTKTRTIEDGCGGLIFKVLDQENSDLVNVEMAMCVFSSGEVAELHYHQNTEEIYFILEGYGEIEMDGIVYPVKPEDAIAIPKMVKHRIRNTSLDSPLRFLSVNSPQWREDDMIRVF